MLLLNNLIFQIQNRLHQKGHESRKGCATQFIINQMRDNKGVFNDSHWEHLSRHIGWESGSKVVSLYVNRAIDLCTDTTGLFTDGTCKNIPSDLEIVNNFKKNAKVYQ